jgi:hypothetical protein
MLRYRRAGQVSRRRAGFLGLRLAEGILVKQRPPIWLGATCAGAMSPARLSPSCSAPCGDNAALSYSRIANMVLPLHLYSLSFDSYVLYILWLWLQSLTWSAGLILPRLRGIVLAVRSTWADADPSSCQRRWQGKPAALMLTREVACSTHGATAM